MARLFDDASSEYLNDSAAVVSGPAFSVGLWFYTDDSAASHGMWSLSKVGSNALQFLVCSRASGGPANLSIQAVQRGAGGAFKQAQSTGTYSLNTWYPTVAVFRTDSDRSIFFKGGRDDNTDAGTSFTPDLTDIGRLGDSTPNWYWSGGVAEVAVWNVALSDGDCEAYEAGTNPLMIRPDALVSYHPLGGIHGDNDNDYWSRTYDMTPVNTPTFTDHPYGLVYPNSSSVSVPQVVAAPADVDGLELVQNSDLTETDSTSEDIILLEAAAVGGGAPTAVLYGPLVGPMGGPI